MAEASRTLAPLASALGGTMMLAGAWAVAPALTAALEDADLARAAAGVVGLLLGLPLAIWPWLVRSGVVEDPGAPWALALSKLAAEHGQQVQTDPILGLWFDLVHGGPRFRVSLDPHRRTLQLSSKRVARHGFIVVPRGVRSGIDLTRWTEIARGRAWSLRVEVRSAGGSVSGNKALEAALDDFFNFAGARSVVFGPDGLRLELESPHPEMADRVVRSATAAARAVWEASSG